MNQYDYKKLYNRSNKVVIKIEKIIKSKLSSYKSPKEKEFVISQIRLMTIVMHNKIINKLEN